MTLGKKIHEQLTDPKKQNQCSHHFVARSFECVRQSIVNFAIADGSSFLILCHVFFLIYFFCFNFFQWNKFLFSFNNKSCNCKWNVSLWHYYFLIHQASNCTTFHVKIISIFSWSQLTLVWRARKIKEKLSIFVRNYWKSFSSQFFSLNIFILWEIFLWISEEMFLMKIRKSMHHRHISAVETLNTCWTYDDDSWTWNTCWHVSCEFSLNFLKEISKAVKWFSEWNFVSH